MTNENGTHVKRAYRFLVISKIGIAIIRVLEYNIAMKG